MSQIVFAEVKSLDNSDNPNGEFEAVISAPSVDRDGEVVDAGAFAKGLGGLPALIPIHAFHDFTQPVGVGAPFYEGDVLKIRGEYDPDPDAQRIRAKVGRSIRHMSVGFMSAKREEQDDATHITSAELLEASFVSVPSNRDAAVIVSRAYDLKVGARNSATDAARLQSAHDVLVELGASCEAKHAPPPVPFPANTGTTSAGSFAAKVLLNGSLTPAKVSGVEATKTSTPPPPEDVTVAASAAAVNAPLADVAVARARAVMALAHAL